jgi:hypothetical protein
MELRALPGVGTASFCENQGRYEIDLSSEAREIGQVGIPLTICGALRSVNENKEVVANHAQHVLGRHDQSSRFVCRGAGDPKRSELVTPPSALNLLGS